MQAADYSIFLANSYLATRLAALSGCPDKGWIQMLELGRGLTCYKVFRGKRFAAPKTTA